MRRDQDGEAISQPIFSMNDLPMQTTSLESVKTFESERQLSAGLVLAAALLLSACGGGSGSSGATGGGGVTPPPPAATSDLVTTVPAATYPQGSELAQAFALINAERGRCGFGLLAQSAQLDVAAAAHARYLSNHGLVQHTEDPAAADFYGADPAARGTKAGYAGSVGEVAGSTVTMFKPYRLSAVPSGVESVRALLSAPYHLWGFTDGFRDVGMAIFGSTLEQGRFVANLGVASGKVRQFDNAVHTYPCEGTTGTAAKTAGETPSPFPQESNPSWGQPILVSGSSDLKLTGVTVTGPNGIAAIKVTYGLGNTVDPNGFFASSTAVAIPQPLSPNTTYNVSITGSNSGASFSKTFSFSTGDY